MLRLAASHDRDLVLQWRNHPEVRAVSLTQHVIAPEEHAAWWAAATADPARRVLVFERHGTPSGCVTFFDLDVRTDVGLTQRSAWWGFFLDVEGLQQRGELLPAWIELMRQATRYAVDDLCLDVLHGEVLERNESVRSLNRRFGIREVGSEQRDVNGTTETVLRLELRAQDVRRTAAGPSKTGAQQ